MNTNINQLVVITGAVGDSGDGLALCIDEQDAEHRVDYAHLMLWSLGCWEHVARVDWRAVGVCSLDGGWLVLGAQGQVVRVKGTDCFEEAIDGFAKIWGMTCIRNIAGTAFAVGMDRQVYLRDKGGQWTQCDDGVKRTSDAERLVGFQAIAGFDVNRLYGCGWRGEIWSQLKGAWHRAPSPTNYILSDICCSDDDQVYAVGQRCTIVHGRGDMWELVQNNGLREDFWGVAWHDDRLYLSTLSALYTLNGEHISRIDLGIADPCSFYHLSANGPWLWSVGLRGIAAKRKGGEWERLR